MVQAIMENQSAKLNKKKVSTKFVAAIGGLTGGLFLMLMGLTLSAISYFKQTSFHGLDVIMLVAAFVFLSIGAHFLDKLYATKKAAKIESYKKHKLTVVQSKEYESADKQIG